MKITLTNKLTLLFFGIFIFISCKEEIIKPLSYGKQPKPVTNYTTESIPGGAKIIFNIPSSDDLLYIKAVYEILPGVKREAKSSLYKNYLIVDGFGKVGDYDVTLYAVSKGEIESVPTHIKITTLTPPYLSAFSSLTMMAVFGGINVTFFNEDEGNLAVQVLVVDSTTKWKPAFTYYTKFKEGNFSVRGYDSISTKFGVYIRDRWGNLSDTITGVFKPLFESLIDKSKFKVVKLPGDVWQAHPGAPQLVIEKVWNNNINPSDDCFHTGPNTGMPQHFSFDMGVKVRLSRFKFHQRPSTYWSAGNPKAFELWGSNDPNIDGSWSSWTKISSYTYSKPSGLPVGTNTSEDLDFAKAGIDFDVPISTPPFRYFRWNTLETWSNMTYISIAELTFWGSKAE